MYVLCPCTVPYPGTKYCMKYRATTIEIGLKMCVYGFWRNIQNVPFEIGREMENVSASKRQTDRHWHDTLNARGSKAKRTTQNISKDLQFNSMRKITHHSNQSITPINHHSATATYTSKVRVFHSNRNSNSSIHHQPPLTWLDLICFFAALREEPWMNESRNRMNQSEEAVLLLLLQLTSNSKLHQLQTVLNR